MPAYPGSSEWGQGSAEIHWLELEFPNGISETILASIEFDHLETLACRLPTMPKIHIAGPQDEVFWILAAIYDGALQRLVEADKILIVLTARDAHNPPTITSRDILSTFPETDPEHGAEVALSSVERAERLIHHKLAKTPTAHQAK